MNASASCLDRHVATWRKNKAALIFEGEPGDSRVLTYGQLHREVCKAANALVELGIGAGDVVAIRMFHWELTTPAPAQAHLALAIDGEVAWEAHVPSPAAGAIVEDEIEIEREVPAGAELQLHVHNHGANSYDLVFLELVPAEEPRSAAR